MTLPAGRVIYPVFPLHGVSFPGHRLPLRVFEPRYLQMLADITESRCFVVALIRSGPEVGGEAMPYPVGTLVDIDTVRGEGEVKRIEPMGRDRVYIENYVKQGKPYLQAECSFYADEPWPAEADAHLLELQNALVAAAKEHAPGTEDGVLSAFDRAKRSLDDENFSLFLCGCLALPPAYRQRFLETRQAVDRMRLAMHLLSQAGKAGT
jgi:uncharacterized protein